ncbi:preprotein translocase subunit SecY [Candidatus Riesia pediculischaeffi]|uniref:Protein translocase subunit SecY n=1 Tax=Candidatus Riesia pediculischaeffi TaxID=428411 RepID=A0A1V0HK77_9ENTR|nr:preprotein translocase subunit SecY [Candidatus Riesia pediculischaeffi]
MMKKGEFNFGSIRHGVRDLKDRLIFIFLSLIIFRAGSFIPIPGIDMFSMTKTFNEQRGGTVIEILNMFSGGAFGRASIFALGIMPYISSSIIVQLLTVIHPKLAEIKKEGEVGRSIINRYIRYGTLLLSFVQSAGISFGMKNSMGAKGLIMIKDLHFYIISIVSLMTGTVFLMWLGEKINEKGIGNGVSMLIFISIVSEIPSSTINIVEQVRQGSIDLVVFFFIIFLILCITCFVTFIERSQRKILVNYARHQYRRRIYSAQSTHLPLKINMASVIPAIFTSSVMLLPSAILTWIERKQPGYLQNLSTLFNSFRPGKPIYMLLYSIIVVFFCFFYTSLLFNPIETADNLKKSGAFLPGIRPGIQTARYIDKIMKRLTFIGSIYISIICLIPELMRELINIPFYFGGTSLLIVVVVIIDFISQIQMILMTNRYRNILKKTNFNSIQNL